MPATVYKPKSPEDAASWYTGQKSSGKIVYWDAVAKQLISTDDSDLRNLPSKNKSKVVRVFSESNLLNYLQGQWEATPTVVGSLISYRGAVYRKTKVLNTSTLSVDSLIEK